MECFGMSICAHDLRRGQFIRHFHCKCESCRFSAISIPCDFSSSNLPVGVQIIAFHFKEERIFEVASAIEFALNRGRK